MVLGLLRRAGHPDHAPNQTAGQDGAQELQRQAELAGQPERHDLGLLVLGQEDQGGPRVGIRGIGVEDSLALEPGRPRRDGTPPGLYKLEVEPRLQPELLPERQGRLLRHRLRPGAARRRRAPARFDCGTGTGRGLRRPGSTTTLRPQNVANLDGNYFRGGMGGNHEFKFGFGYREVEVDSNSIYGGDPTASWAMNYGRGQTRSFAATASPGTKSQLHERLHQRHLHQGPPDHQPGPALRPADLGSVPSARAGQPGLIPNRFRRSTSTAAARACPGTTSRRASASRTRSTRAARRVVRASYAKYASQISHRRRHLGQPDRLGQLPRLLLGRRQRGRGWSQRDEVLLDQGIQYYGYVDPANPTRRSRPNTIDPDLPPTRTTSSWPASTTSCSPTSRSSGAYTWRKSNDIPWQPRNGLTRRLHRAAPVTRNRSPTSRAFSRDPFGRRAACRGAPTPTGPTTPTLQRRRALDDQAPVQQVDGPRGLLLERLDRELRRRTWPATPASRPRRAPRPITFGAGAHSGPLVDGGQVAQLSGGSGKGNVIYYQREVAGHRERASSNCLGTWSSPVHCSHARATRGRPTSPSTSPARRLDRRPSRRQRGRPPLRRHRATWTSVWPRTSRSAGPRPC